MYTIRRLYKIPEKALDSGLFRIDFACLMAAILYFILFLF